MGLSFGYNYSYLVTPILTALFALINAVVIFCCSTQHPFQLYKISCWIMVMGIAITVCLTLSFVETFKKTIFKVYDTFDERCDIDGGS